MGKTGDCANVIDIINGTNCAGLSVRVCSLPLEVRVLKVKVLEVKVLEVKIL